MFVRNVGSFNTRTEAHLRVLMDALVGKHVCTHTLNLEDKHVVQHSARFTYFSSILIQKYRR